ncbi:hypothetical protein BRARA_F02199 [Brassica rapa]|uniref:Uncharacterized protein n=1 Tax=Brassica campestris TaxID=3711 RepID=A0A397YZR7_BRACM|nr:hypothetical protein BRARA_F02199 [Brassica rapa]
MFSPINRFQLSLSTLLPSPGTVSAPRYQIIPLGTDLNWLLLLTDFQESFYTWPP